MASDLYFNRFWSKNKEALFAQANNFLARTHPLENQAMLELRVDLETAVKAILFKNLRETQFKNYQPLKPYFVKIFLRELPLQHRAKFRVGTQI